MLHAATQTNREPTLTNTTPKVHRPMTNEEFLLSLHPQDTPPITALANSTAFDHGPSHPVAKKPKLESQTQISSPSPSFPPAATQTTELSCPRVGSMGQHPPAPPPTPTPTTNQDYEFICSNAELPPLSLIPVIEGIPVSPALSYSGDDEEEEDEEEVDYVEVPADERDSWEWEVVDEEVAVSAAGLLGDGRHGWILRRMRRAVE